ncbi:hypothetical protein [Aliamphritea hakodatensis]|uniref:hypothetical protein n=1 Tax=Aliamphritea hakodatensis TaxID=2895352 RepID=UPI0022FD7D82|nr:hypothetical protein [Aliamphritea hakodatensis]
MKLISARQAWHDCYLDSQVSPLERYIETARLCAQVQYSSKLNTANKAAHQAQAGLIQSAIGTLPVPLQALGHWLYAPQGVFGTEKVSGEWVDGADGAPEYKVLKDHGHIENAVWQMIAVKLGIEDQHSDEWYLVRCSMHAYRELAWGRDALLKRPKYIAQWLEEQHGIDIDTRNFYRGLGKVQTEVLMLLDDLDKKALEPVAKLIAEMTSEVEEGEESV